MSQFAGSASALFSLSWVAGASAAKAVGLTRATEASAAANYDRSRQSAVTLLTSPQVRYCFDVRRAEPRVLDRYGDNSFGWSLLMARRLVEAGVNMVQVNMGNFGSWDLHGNNYPCLKNYLFPPTDRAVCALLDDLHDSGLLDSPMVVMAGEFGRTPQITHIARNIYRTPGRDHWGPVQTAWFAGNTSTRLAEAERVDVRDRARLAPDDLAVQRPALGQRPQIAGERQLLPHEPLRLGEGPRRDLAEIDKVVRHVD